MAFTEDIDTFFGDFYFDNGVQAYPQYAGKIKGHFMFDCQTLYLVFHRSESDQRERADYTSVFSLENAGPCRQLLLNPSPLATVEIISSC